MIPQGFARNHVLRILYFALFAVTLLAQDNGPKFEQWGGDHVELRLASNGGEFNFDCAHGQFSGPLKTGLRGEFSVRGTFTPSYPGPTRDDIHLTRPVTFTGNIRKNAMTLRLNFDDGRPAQTYTLEKGRSGPLTTCR